VVTGSLRASTNVTTGSCSSKPLQHTGNRMISFTGCRATKNLTERKYRPHREVVLLRMADCVEIILAVQDPREL